MDPSLMAISLVIGIVALFLTILCIGAGLLLVAWMFRKWFR